MINTKDYPFISSKFSSIKNLKYILTAINDEFNNIFNLAALNEFYSSSESTEPPAIVRLFEDSVLKVVTAGENFYDVKEVTADLVKFLFAEISLRAGKDFTVFDSNSPSLRQIGIAEKFKEGVLSYDHLDQYAFDTIDMVRSARAYPDEKINVVALEHLKFLTNSGDLLDKHLSGLFIRCRPKATTSLPQWITLYKNTTGNICLYSESPLSELDKTILEQYLSVLGTSLNAVQQSGMTAALSISSGIRAVTKWNEQCTKVGLSIEADYPSLFAEWVFLVQDTSPRFQNFSWGEMKSRVLCSTEGKFAIMEICKPIAPALQAYNAFTQMRSYNLGLDWLMADEDIKLLTTDEKVVSLHIAPDVLKLEQASLKYQQTTADSSAAVDLAELFVRKGYATKTAYSFGSVYHHLITTELGGDKNLNNVIAGMVLHVFRACAKKPILNIDIPHQCRLNRREQALIKTLMDGNPFVCELRHHDHPDLRDLNQSLLHLFARNRWLQSQGYLPPLIADFWKEAASKWLAYLSQNPSSLLANEEDKESFRTCVFEMGIHGLKPVLSYLSTHDTSLKPMFNPLLASKDIRPGFYAACRAQDMEEYSQSLLSHLNQGRYFPFTEFHLSFEPGVNETITNIFHQLNQLKSFQKLNLVNCLSAGKIDDFEQLLQQILQKTKDDESWTCPIHIPELDQSAKDEQLKRLREIYLDINNQLIIRNRRKNEDELYARADIKAAEPADLQLQGGADVLAAREGKDFSLQLPLFQSIPWQRSGGLSLQMQQQQQIQQQRSQSIDLENEKGSAYEDILPAALVEYKNIDRLLGTYYKKSNAEHQIDETKAGLRVHGETLLQGFFRTWINANPDVNAKHIISKMTPDAARMLLKYHRQLSGGLNPYNLPKCFFTQRDALGHLVLGYKSSLQYTTDSNPLTLKLTADIPKPEQCGGNFRQFSLDDRFIPLFSYLQSQPDDVDKAYMELESKIPTLAKCNDEVTERIKGNFHLFNMLYTLNGEQCIKDFAPPVFEEMKQLFLTFFIKEEQKFIADSIIVDQQALVAMGQILFRYDRFGLELFLNQLHNLARIDHFLLACFQACYLSKCLTFSPLLDKASLDALSSMSDFFRDNKGIIPLWNVFLQHHTEAVGWEDFSQLWKGFSYFYQKLNDLGLEKEIKPQLLNGIRPQNMFTYFDRILLSLEKMPNQDQQIDFLAKIASLDMTEGGAPYAIRHERFVVVDDELQLQAFTHGTPTYKPDMKVLFEPKFDILSMHRALASQTHIKASDYHDLTRSWIVNDTIDNKYALLLLMHTKFSDELAAFKALIEDVANKEALKLVAVKFFDVFYNKNQLELRYSFNLLQTIVSDIREQQAPWQALFTQFDNLWVLDCLQLLEQHHCLNSGNLSRVTEMFASISDFSAPQLRQGLLLATMYQVGSSELAAFIGITSSLKGNVRQELILLSNQLLSLNLANIQEEAVYWSEIWSQILASITSMNQHPDDCEKIRFELMNSLAAKGLTFTSSLAGDYCLLKEDELEEVEAIKQFNAHESRLSKFFTQHLAKSQTESATDALRPILNFFKRLQLNKTYINEIEPLIAMLEKSKSPGKCWTTNFFNQLLQALEPQEAQGSFPVAIFEAMITEAQSIFRPREIDHLVIEFPRELASDIKMILGKSQTFNRLEQMALVIISLRINQYDQKLDDMIRVLSEEKYSSLRGVILKFLISVSADQITQNFEMLQKVVELNPDQLGWSKTCQLWFEVLSQKPEAYLALLNRPFEASLALADDKKASILHIVAWTSIPSETLISATSKLYLEKGTSRQSKAEKLIARLSSFSQEDLMELAKVYPSKPAPDAAQLLQLIKPNDKKLLEKIKIFQSNSRTCYKKDYAALSTNREQDFQRMLEETRVISGETSERFDLKEGLRLSLMFKYLKELEFGNVVVDSKPINQMSQDELKDSFYKLSEEEASDITNTQIWAILFEVIGRTTGKYPHLAQQFSLIANEIVLSDAESSILQLKTGEGKSHFVALRAARYVGQGQKVDVCTAKWTLAARDLMDYKAFFDYLGIKTANITSSTVDKKTYEEAQVVYTTPGDFSLFLDNHAFQGNPVIFPEKKPVCLGDEFDFLFYEGQKVQYNYAQHTGISPKEMSWFYRSINDFYAEHQHEQHEIKAGMLSQCMEYLTAKAGSRDERLSYLASIGSSELASWLQSAHEAASMAKGVNYTVRLEQVKIGEEELPLQEIYPLTKDMQAAVGSSFSHGVHQLLAERLNQQAQLKDEAQNFHVHPESHIVSSQVFSQRLKELWSKWEGFTGTVSATQAQQLHQGYGTKVLQVPTNQKDLRKWPEPEFFTNEAQRLAAMAEKIKVSLSEKKSILWCCETDAKVLEMQENIKRFFTEEEWRSHFMVFTNESHQTAAQVLRAKKEQEGMVLGQKARGVVLMAAGFGRGDNVDVEVVMLQSVYDENDLGQKGGRTARNGAEGEVQQFYMTKDVQQNFSCLMEKIQEDGSPYAEYNEIIQEKIQAKYPDLSKISIAEKFKLCLCVAEFIQSVDNQASVYYHESKAKISASVFELLPKIAVPDERQCFARQFSSQLEKLEAEWTKIKATTTSTKASISGLKGYLETIFKDAFNMVLGRVDEGKTFVCEFDDYKGLTFLLETQTQGNPSAVENAIQRHLLSLEAMPVVQSRWTDFINKLYSLNQPSGGLDVFHHQLVGVKDFRDCERLLERSLEQVEGEFHQSFLEAEQLVKKSPKEKLLIELGSINHDLITITQSLAKDIQDKVLDYFTSRGPTHLTTSVKRIYPLLTYVASFPLVEEKKASTYFANTLRTGNLIELPADCFSRLIELKIHLNAEILCQIQQILDKYLSGSDGSQYVEIFTKMAQGCSLEPDSRIRWFEHFNRMLDVSANKLRLLTALSDIMQSFKEKEYYEFATTLWAITAPLYSKSPEQVDDIFDQVVKHCPNILEALPPLFAILTRHGKEVLENTENILSLLSTSTLIFYQEVLTQFARRDYTSSKQEEVTKSAKVLQQLETYSTYQHPANVTEKMQALTSKNLEILLEKCTRDKAFKDHSFLFEYLIDHIKDFSVVQHTQLELALTTKTTMFVDYKDILPCLITFLQSSTFEKTTNTQSWLDLIQDYIQRAGSINQDHLRLLGEYEKEPGQFTVLKDMIEWHQISSDTKSAYAELWLRPDRINLIAELSEEQYQHLAKAYRQEDIREIFVRYPETLDCFVRYLGSDEETRNTQSWLHLMKDYIARVGADGLEQYLVRLDVYQQDPRAFKVLTDMIQWHQTSSDTTSAYRELWLRPDRINLIAALSEEQYQHLAKAYRQEDIREIFVRYPATLDCFVRYLGSEAYDARLVDGLVLSLVKIGTISKDQVEIVQYLREYFYQFDVLNIKLELILQHPTFALEIAFNGLADKIQAKPAEQDEMKQAISTFYSKRQPRNISSNFDMEPPEGVFNFTEKPKDEQRISLMRLLHCDAFVSTQQIDGEALWRKEENDRYYEKSLKKYSDFVENELLLSPNTKLAEVRAVADIEKIKGIAEELREVATIKERRINAQVLPNALQAAMSATLHNYKRAWFKNEDRQQQLFKLEAIINENTADEQPYFSLLKKLHQLQEDVKHSDADASQTVFRRFFQPLHKNGSSRLLNTLNTMQDNIIKAWLEDTSAMHSFRDEYQDFINQALHAKMKNFGRQLSIWIDANTQLNKTCQESKFFAPLQHNIGKLFLVDEAKIERAQALLFTLNAEEIDMENKIKQISYHSAIIKNLPGHLQVLANDISSYQKDYECFALRA